VHINDNATRFAWDCQACMVTFHTFPHDRVFTVDLLTVWFVKKDFAAIVPLLMAAWYDYTGACTITERKFLGRIEYEAQTVMIGFHQSLMHVGCVKTAMDIHPLWGGDFRDPRNIVLDGVPIPHSEGEGVRWCFCQITSLHGVATCRLLVCKWCGTVHVCMVMYSMYLYSDYIAR